MVKENSKFYLAGASASAASSMVDSMAHSASCAWFILMILCIFYDCVMYFIWFSKDGTWNQFFPYPDQASYRTVCIYSFSFYIPNIIPCIFGCNQSPFQVLLTEESDLECEHSSIAVVFHTIPLLHPLMMDRSPRCLPGKFLSDLIMWAGNKRLLLTSRTLLTF